MIKTEEKEEAKGFRILKQWLVGIDKDKILSDAVCQTGDTPDQRIFIIAISSAILIYGAYVCVDCVRLSRVGTSEKPLITIPMDKLGEFTKIAEKYNWQVTDIKENLYRTTTPEVIVNGMIKTPNESLEIEKSLKKIYRIYKIQRIKHQIQHIFFYPQKLWK